MASSRAGTGSLTFIQRALHILDRVLRYLELQGVGLEEAGGTLDQQSIDLGFAGLRVSWQGDVVERASLRGRLGILRLLNRDTVDNLEVLVQV